MTNFLSLPFEIRQEIYDLSVTVQQLTVQNLCDLEERPAGIPSLLRVNKLISEEAAAVFYSRAVLNLAPLRLPPYLSHSLPGDGPNINLAFGLDVEFSSYPRRHLQRITRSHIYSGQCNHISAEACEALLRWLVDNTAVHTVHLSRRLMTRLRGARVDVKAAFNLYAVASSLTLIRTIYVYSSHCRSPWEASRMRRLKKALDGLELPTVQVYVLEQGGQNDVLLDPRWDARISDNDERRSMTHQTSSWFDSLLAAVPANKRGGLAEDEPQLYQICCIFRRLQPTTG